MCEQINNQKENRANQGDFSLQNEKDFIDVIDEVSINNKDISVLINLMEEVIDRFDFKVSEKKFYFELEKMYLLLETLENKCENIKKILKSA